MFIDEVDISITAGHGGSGKVSFAGNGPDGGNGGRGGSVYLTVTSDLKMLNQFSSTKRVIAENGQPGMSRTAHGKSGRDTILVLPIGTTLTDQDTGQTWELTSLNQKILICPGGLGGRGNTEFKSSTHQSPKYAQPGLPGKSRKLSVVLRYLADYGLVGLPNAGKSSLLNALTNSTASVGAYPFTTLEANLGALGPHVLADIPGLIAGASTGKGLGTKFLKHIEKVTMLLHCISVESSDVLADFKVINHELEQFNPALIAKPRLILLTKTDLSTPATLADQLVKLSALEFPILPVSVLDSSSLQALTDRLSN